MNEKEIFNIVDNISEENLSMIMGKADINIIIENSVGSYKAKEIIRAKLHGKIKQDKEVRAVSQENIINNKEIVKLEDTESLLKRESKKGKRVKGNKVINNIIKSVVAAMFVFVVSVNIFPDLALALVKIPGLNKLIEIVTFDKGFKNVIDNGNIQYVNTIIEDKGVKFTVNTIAGDDLKLWIGYELEGEGSILGEIKFKNKADGKDLPWMARSQDEGKKYIEVNMDSLVKDFEMKIDVYKNDVSFHTPLSQLDEKAISDVKQLFEKSKITTLSVPISLNNKIYNKDLRVLNIRGKEFKSEIGIFKIEKLELSKSRSRIYFKLLSEENELLEVLVPRLVDGEGKEYSKSYNGLTCNSGNNMICVELSGGIKSVKGLSFKCNGFKYINKKDKNITIDFKNKQIEYNVPRGFDMKVVD
ncbi:DUF4179 domain-containing protein [Clostridium tagluense]|uniref:DUF4179 domain-containing protein n=1 Tax=Clostridium tagluense TaxID=360422 RepID=UPI001C0DAA3C|nr:DUF4179 domain-containing protein [Clostridium tagluense]MBU3130531.1 DUF4179 domain-containing protein [Clostridium tagluense]MCB2312892.1 DUF4179 domain-containing protein [Clostridium tagluense]MCB2317658.1 DUF4179 domain-containing protein [Clostridium tagluense]MCB2322508.1 DUF4179 domain-containing protein [Clostridium tagluense]MCB2327510.1 DUF4179 domain-containing protein [Clostridium tagluense]